MDLLILFLLFYTSLFCFYYFTPSNSLLRIFIPNIIFISSSPTHDTVKGLIPISTTQSIFASLSRTNGMQNGSLLILLIHYSLIPNIIFINWTSLFYFYYFTSSNSLLLNIGPPYLIWSIPFPPLNRYSLILDIIFIICHSLSHIKFPSHSSHPLSHKKYC